MTTRHELPTHLGVEDAVVFGLSTRQVGMLVGGAAGSDACWTSWPDLPAALHLGLPALIGAVALAVALVRPGGRGLDDWALVALAYLLLPRRARWRAVAPHPAAWRAEEGVWRELRLTPAPRERRP